MTTPGEVRRSVEAALADLGRLHTDDPAATTARRAVDLTRVTLECFWVPALDADGHVEEA